MRRWVYMILGVGLVLALSTQARETQCTEQSQAEQAVVAGNTAFALDLYSNLSRGEENLFFSPWSISAALAMTWQGARGTTEAEMARVLHFTLPQDEFHPAFSILIENVEKAAGENELSVANSLWGQRGYEFRSDFLKQSQEIYQAGLREVDFEGAPEQARQAINEWVEAQTKDKIKDLIQRGMIDPSTVLILANAIYFNGKWEKPFDEKRTREDRFHLLRGESVEARFMNKLDRYLYLEQEDFQAIELPYAGKSLAMTIFLPKEVSGLPALEAILTQENLSLWISQLRWKQVQLSIPRFRMTSQFTLSQTLQAMGMVEAFQGGADFSGMSKKNDLAISEVVHKAFVDVSEEGTEAAAATAVMMMRTSVSERPDPPVIFRADRPFLFLIRDKTSGTVLFLGRVMNPAD